jgi:hypothetical protein
VFQSSSCHPIKVKRAVARLPPRLDDAERLQLTAEESVPTGTVVSPVAIFAAPSSSISAERSPNHVTWETADSRLHWSLPIRLASSPTSKRVMPAGIGGLLTPSTNGLPRLFASDQGLPL